MYQNFRMSKSSLSTKEQETEILGTDKDFNLSCYFLQTPSIDRVLTTTNHHQDDVVQAHDDGSLCAVVASSCCFQQS